ncbi:MAG: hypothetical protein ALAOOOJD_01438 [bacterium]|nr:hypothetical protein [bacterium]
MIAIIQVAAQTVSNPALGMTTAGWIFMSLAWLTIISVAVFCYRKVLQKAAEKQRRALLESPSLHEQMTEKRPII